MQMPLSLSSPLGQFGANQASWLMQDGTSTWYHENISREAAENLLQNKPLGCFLVRASQRHGGYTLTYRARDCCRHFMIKLLPDGRLVIPGEKGIHSTLVELVSFYQKTPFQPYMELLTQPFGQEDEYSNMALDINTIPVNSSSTHMPKPNSSLPINVSLKPMPLSQKRMMEMPKADSSQPWVKPLEQLPALGHAQMSEKVLLHDAPQKIWKNIKNLPQAGKKITEQIKTHLSGVKLSFPSSVVADSHVEGQAREAPGPEGDGSATQVEYNRLPKHTSHPKIQDLHLPPRKMFGTSITPIPTSKDAILPTPRRGVISGTIHQRRPRPTVNSSFPEEYHPPPPFAPGY
ncbi:hematopoietic SH2 domain-containing protein [Dromiciops gliroides]|uniref:hematopoietic SH2 domain-containing protein n=1 Tax=Dromiciops gliroides TaxID=33562 RepID=UPI001CC5D8C8|nr:hematopoietic SH2 domain-containing protein [Dromiciops gliroides]